MNCRVSSWSLVTAVVRWVESCRRRLLDLSQQPFPLPPSQPSVEGPRSLATSSSTYRWITRRWGPRTSSRPSRESSTPDSRHSAKATSVGVLIYRWPRQTDLSHLSTVILTRRRTAIFGAVRSSTLSHFPANLFKYNTYYMHVKQNNRYCRCHL